MLRVARVAGRGVAAGAGVDGVCFSVEAGARLALWKPAEALVRGTEWGGMEAKAVYALVAGVAAARRAAMRGPSVHGVRAWVGVRPGAKRVRGRSRRASSSCAGSGSRAPASWRVLPGLPSRIFDARGRRARGHRQAADCEPTGPIGSGWGGVCVERIMAAAAVGRASRTIIFLAVTAFFYVILIGISTLGIRKFPTPVYRIRFLVYIL